MQTNPAANNLITGKAGASPVLGNTKVSSDMFLNLLVTQLKNQDPLSPTDNTAFVAQLAQFSSLEGINNLNKSFTGVSDSMDALSNYGMAGLIGRNVTTEGGSFGLKDSPVALGYDLENPAEAVTLTVSDSEGRVVGTATARNVPAGSHEFIWDGRAKDGSMLPAGVYDFSVKAGSGADALALHTFISGVVDGIDLSGTAPMISIGGAMFPADGIKEVF